MDIKDFTEEQLRAELKRRDDDARAAAKKLQDERNARIAELINNSLFLEMLNLFAPSHSRTSCIEGSTINVGRCERCTMQDQLVNDECAQISNWKLNSR